MKKSLHPVLKNILLAMLFLFPAMAFAQGSGGATAISLQTGTISRKHILSQIESQTSYKFSYDLASFDDKANISVSSRDNTVDLAMAKVTANSGHSYIIDGGYIIIHKDRNTVENANIVVEALRTVSGIVTDAATGQPKSGVSVELVDGAAIKSVTNALGRFTLANVSAGNRVVKLTAEDGTVRFREINVPASRDTDVALSFNNEIMVADTAPATQEQDKPDVKSVAYYVQSGGEPQQVRLYGRLWHIVPAVGRYRCVEYLGFGLVGKRLYRIIALLCRHEICRGFIAGSYCLACFSLLCARGGGKYLIAYSECHVRVACDWYVHLAVADVTAVCRGEF